MLVQNRLDLAPMAQAAQRRNHLNNRWSQQQEQEQRCGQRKDEEAGRHIRDSRNDLGVDVSDGGRTGEEQREEVFTQAADHADRLAAP